MKGSTTYGCYDAESLDYDSGVGANEHWLGINSKFKGLGQPYFSRMMVITLIIFGFKLI